MTVGPSTIRDYISDATAQFEAADIPSARLDAQVLACHALHKNKAWLLAHGEDTFLPDAWEQLQNNTQRRANREPIAYIVGYQEFYGRRFIVTPDVLIPRPATEQIIEEIKSLPLPHAAHLLDIGTGSGAIAITASLERPELRVDACDISPAALSIAEQNSQRLAANVHFFTSDLLQNATQHYDIIAANLPYVSHDWQRSPETNFEPSTALFAQNNGLALIHTLLQQAPQHLTDDGILLLEADPRQFTAIAQMASTHFAVLHSVDYTITLKLR